MEIKLLVHLELKGHYSDWSNQVWQSHMKNGAKIKIDICDKKCKIMIIHDTEDNVKNLYYVIWELLAWYDGYFYKPTKYYLGGKRKKVAELYPIKMYSTPKWIESALLIGRRKRSFSEEIILKYEDIRNAGRKEQSMNRAMIFSYFNLLSEAYKDINLEHRLVLMMHICDGFAVQFLGGNRHNNIGNISILVRQLDSKKFKQGANMLGMSSSAAIDALGYTRDELTHYDYNKGSLGARISDVNSAVDHKIYLYAFYILELALRVSLLETIGFRVEDEVREYIFEENFNWIELVKFLEAFKTRTDE